MSKLSRFFNVWRGRSVDREFEDELRFHLEMRAERNLRGGMERRAAEAEARRHLGGVLRTKEGMREARVMVWLDHLRQDVLYALRTSVRNPGFTAVAVLTLALGIGASAAIFSVAHAVLLRPLPYKNPDRLVFVMPELRKRYVKDYLFSSTDFLDVRHDGGAVFEDLGALVTGRTTRSKEDGSLEEIRFALVTTNFFRLMGLKMVLGRDFIDADAESAPYLPRPVDAPAAGHPSPVPALATILSYEYWQRRFGGSPAILGHDLPGSAPGATPIVGVLAPGFELFFPPNANIERAPDTWYAARLPYDNALRGGVYLRAIGRMREGVTLGQAQSAVELTAAELRKKSNLWEAADLHLRVAPMQQHLVEQVRPALLALAGAAICLLLIACANVANLLLVRASRQAREFAVRTALGASRWRLVWQTFAEALLLAVIGGTLGIGVASAGVDTLRVLAPANLPRLDLITIDGAVLAFAASAMLATAAIVGSVPAWRASRPDVAHVLHARSPTAGVGHAGLLRDTVVIVAVALSLVLLTGSGLMVRSFFALQRINPQYQSQGLLTFQLVYGGGDTQLPQRKALTREIEDRLRAIPGVQQVTASTPFPLAGGFNATRYGPEQALADPTKFQSADFQTVLPGYFETLRTPLLVGRTFTDADNASARGVVIVDELLAAKAFPNESAVGKRLVVNRDSLVEVIGVVAHQRATSLAELGHEQLFFTDGFMGHGVVSRWAIRTAGDSAQYASAVRAEMAKLGSRLVVGDMQPMDNLVERAEAGTRFSLLLLGVFAVTAALLAGVGLYGVVSTVVRHRTAEIGIRVALGATPAKVLWLVVGHGLRLSAAGMVVGLVAAFGLTHALTSMLVGVTATDAPTFAATAALLLVIGTLASWLPARRAARIDPTAALRQE